MMRFFLPILRSEILNELDWEDFYSGKRQCSNQRSKMRSRARFHLPHLDRKLRVRRDLRYGQNHGLWLSRNFVKPGCNFLKVSFNLREVIGVQSFHSKHQIVNQVWEYVRQNNLQDPEDHRFIVPDRKLGKLTGKGKKKCSRSKLIRDVKKNIL